MKKNVLLISAFCFVFFISFFIISQGVSAAGSKQEAVSMVEKAVAYYKANGKQKTFDAVNTENGLFQKGDVYVYLHDLVGSVLAHPTNKSLIGKNNIKMRDPDGKFFVKEIVNCAKDQGTCWVSYKWTNPKTKKVQKKEVYCQKVDDIIFVCGIYI